MTNLEDELFYVAEMWKMLPNQIMKLGVSKRKRLIEKKVDLEDKRQAESRRTQKPLSRGASR